MNYIVLDLEATCWEERGSGKISEIIEIGALRFDEAHRQTGEFSRFVRPVIHPDLSPFCTELTSITQEEVESAALFPEVIQDFWDWIGKDFWLCSWGFYDRNQFRQDCEYHQLDTDWLSNHISLKHQHAQIVSARRAMGMKWALKKEGFQLDGTHHRGIDDARNIAKIYLKYVGEWVF